MSGCWFTVLGAVALVVLLGKVVAGRRWHHHHHGFHGGPGMMLGWLLRRLRTTPEQERVVLDAVDEVMDQVRKQRREWRHTRVDVAAAMRRPDLDAESMGEMFARQDTAITEVRKAVVGALTRIHDVLDPKQREDLATVLESGPPWMGGCHRW